MGFTIKRVKILLCLIGVIVLMSISVGWSGMLNNIVGFFTNFTVSLTFFLHCGFWYLGALALSFLAVYWENNDQGQYSGKGLLSVGKARSLSGPQEERRARRRKERAVAAAEASSRSESGEDSDQHLLALAKSRRERAAERVRMQVESGV